MLRNIDFVSHAVQTACMLMLGVSSYVRGLYPLAMVLMIVAGASATSAFWTYSFQELREKVRDYELNLEKRKTGS